jgi:hypothetical protein
MKTVNFHRTLLVVLALLAVPATSYAQAWGVGVSIGIAPPALPVYVQPPCPAAGYLWTPGYWAYDPEDGYYWVPGTWVLAPASGLLWTPGYWGFAGGFYAWHAGYWGPRVGFYGGINYGFGYFGSGFAGGHWDRDRFFYNRSVSNINNVSITNVYNDTVVHNHLPNARASYNGGPGGSRLRPTADEQAAEHAPHYAATTEQQRHESAARALPALRASVNRGQPPVAASPRPGVLSDHGADRSPPQRRTIDAPQQRLAHQPAAHSTAPALSAPAYQHPQHNTPGPSYSARAPMSVREPVRAPASYPAHAAGIQAPTRTSPPAHANAQGPWHGPGHS